MQNYFIFIPSPYPLPEGDLKTHSRGLYMIKTIHSEIKKLLSTDLLSELSDYQLISVSGPDAAKFLQGQLTCDVREITPTQSGLGAYCNHKGRVLVIFRIFYHNEKYYLFLPTAMTESTLKILKKFAVFSKVTLAIETSWLKLAAAGAKIETLLATHFLNLPQQINNISHTETMVIIRIAGAEPRYQIFAPPDLLQKLIHQGSVFSNEAAPKIWQLQNIAAGIPEIYPETFEMFTPHMLNLDQLGAVSLQKGCYVGQEIIARTQYLGKSKRRLTNITASTNEIITPGTHIVNEQQQEVGQVVSGVNIDNFYYGLAVIPEDPNNNLRSLPIEVVLENGGLRVQSK